MFTSGLHMYIGNIVLNYIIEYPAITINDVNAWVCARVPLFAFGSYLKSIKCILEHVPSDH